VGGSPHAASMARATPSDAALASQPGLRFSRARYRWRSTERTPSAASKQWSPSGGLAGGHFSMVARVSSTVVWTRITRGLGALSRAHVTAGRTTWRAKGRGRAGPSHRSTPRSRSHPWRSPDRAGVERKRPRVHDSAALRGSSDPRPAFIGDRGPRHSLPGDIWATSHPPRETFRRRVHM
jgi:hypothetical protein